MCHALRPALPLLLLAAPSMTGCAVSASQTSRQLARGETVLSVGADTPGAFALPNLRFQYQTGVAGVGDLSWHLGAVPLTFMGAPLHAGAGLRVYPTDGMTWSVNGDLFGSLGSGRGPKLAVTWRATSTTHDTRRLYGGLHLVAGWTLDGHGIGGGNLGLVGGWESRPDARGSTYQLELTLAPLGFNHDGEWALIRSELRLGRTDEPAPFVGQLSFSYYFSSGTGRAATPSPTPGEADDSRAQSGALATTHAEHRNHPRPPHVFHVKHPRPEPRP